MLVNLICLTPPATPRVRVRYCPVLPCLPLRSAGIPVLAELAEAYAVCVDHYDMYCCIASSGNAGILPAEWGGDGAFPSLTKL